MCNITKCCTEVCPEHIKITDNAIIPMKERVVDVKFDPWSKVTAQASPNKSGRRPVAVRPLRNARRPRRPRRHERACHHECAALPLRPRHHARPPAAARRPAAVDVHASSDVAATPTAQSRLARSTGTPCSRCTVLPN